MNRVHLWLAALQVLSLVAIGWLWSENRSLRTHGAGGDSAPVQVVPADSGNHQGELTARSEVKSGPRLGPRRQDLGDTPQTRNLNGPEAATRRSTPLARQDPPPVGSIGSLEKELPVDSPSLPETRVIVATEPGVESLIVNGGFDGELHPWICHGGRVIRDPADEKNWVLEATQTGERFSLRQLFFKPPARKVPMTLSFRAMISEDAALSGFNLIMMGQDERPLAQTVVTAGTPGEWKKIEWKGSTPVSPAVLSIGMRGKGIVWIDDVRLVPSATAPEPPQGQPSP